MELLNPRAHLLSNFEVLALLKELEQEQLAETRAAFVSKQEKEKEVTYQNGDSSNIESHLKSEPDAFSHQPPILEPCENLRTVEFETIAHLTSSFQPTRRQTSNGIISLMRSLRAYNLTKAEKLQIVNLAPVQAVELYVIVEELEDRLSDSMNEILHLVQQSLVESPEGEDVQERMIAAGSSDEDHQIPVTEAEPDQGYDEGEEERMKWEDGGDDFVDDGGGFEGDLETGDDPD